MLLDRTVHKSFQHKYGFDKEHPPVVRTAIKCLDGESIVELYPKQIRLMPLPNT
jgi:hypothetical protein